MTDAFTQDRTIRQGELHVSDPFILRSDGQINVLVQGLHSVGTEFLPSHGETSHLFRCDHQNQRISL